MIHRPACFEHRTEENKVLQVTHLKKLLLWRQYLFEIKRQLLKIKDLGLTLETDPLLLKALMKQIFNTEKKYRLYNGILFPLQNLSFSCCF